ncbi:hypothetical protein FGG08_007362 [Glutinoglossum americanum]|uniref:alpha-1,2-Mannosidase n=1 Tax=Glutinoglossum americanum TaxID=1670608 RepID=A0A9P8I3H5_9PEZI|nr:hypothetical protein FGG08_007362 [Glutinoglossum americanum]
MRTCVYPLAGLAELTSELTTIPTPTAPALHYSMPPAKRFTILCCIAAAFLLVGFYRPTGFRLPQQHLELPHRPPIDDGRSRWANRPQQHPVTSMTLLPSGGAASIPRIQHDFGGETAEVREVRETRLQTVKDSFVHTWKGYKEHAWMEDELAPLSGGNRTTFGGWAATLVDSLDTLWIMGLHDDFEQAAAAIKHLDFASPKTEFLNVFETTIRYLGGFLAAYDISDGKYPILLEKAIEVGEMLYAAFDTPNRMPVARWNWRGAALGNPQEAQDHTLLAEIGTLSLEFTRLSQLSKDPKYFDAISRITEQFDSQQMRTNLPGMWAIAVNARTANFSQGSYFTLGAMADSLYEYFSKEYILLGGRSEQYRRLYERFIDVAKEHLFFQPLTKDNRDILLSGGLTADTPTERIPNPHCQHLGCFTGGMVAMGARIFDRPADLAIGRKLMEGCVWAYETMPSGIMPESFDAVQCGDVANCMWDENRWFEAVGKKVGEGSEADKSLSFEERVRQKIQERRLVPGISSIGDRRYILRPEAIESVFILYRITGDTTLQDTAWTMFQAITKHTRTKFAHAALGDVTVGEPPQVDSMESFWTAETLKYFYLIFSKPEVVSLDNYVLNTEAHPFRRPK